MDEKQIKAGMVDVCRRMWQLGWVAANDGNVTVKLDSNAFLATPTGVSKSEVSEDMIIKVDKNGEVLEGKDGYRPSSEVKMHLRCYAARDDINAVVHAHPPTATAFAVAGIPMDMYILPETILTLGAVPIAPYGTPSTDEIPDAVEPFLANHDAVLLQNHGALSVGADLKTAYYRMETLELTAKIELNARMLGGEKELRKPDIDTLCSMRRKFRITGKHPGYIKYQ